jgi:hypothetical protein
MDPFLHLRPILRIGWVVLAIPPDNIPVMFILFLFVNPVGNIGTVFLEIFLLGCITVSARGGCEITSTWRPSLFAMFVKRLDLCYARFFFFL